jgi:cytochrome P450
MQKVAYIRGLDAALVAAGALSNSVLTLQRAHARHGPLIAVRLPSLSKRQRHTVLVADPLMARAVLQQAEVFNNVALYPVRGPQTSAQRRLRWGIIRVNGARHDHQRAQAAPYLARKRVEQLAPRVRDICRQEAEAWPVGQRADLVTLVNRMTRRIAFEVLFGEPDAGEGLAMSDTGARHLAMSRDLLALGLPIDLPFTPYGRLLRLAERVELILKAWIARRRDAPRGENMMSMLLDAVDETGAPLTDEDAAAQLWTLYGASYDTTSSTLAWILLLLAQHPEVSRRLLQELQAAPAGESPLYLSWVIKEGMRLCTPVPLQIRKAAVDALVPGSDLRVRRGDHLILSDIVANRAETYFSDPLAFRPERWADPNLPDAAALTFSAGPRGCIGFWFAMAALESAISAIWPRVRIAVKEGARIDFRTLITMNAEAIPVRLHAQDGRFTAARIRGPVVSMASALGGPTRPKGGAVVQPIIEPGLAEA